MFRYKLRTLLMVLTLIVVGATLFGTAMASSQRLALGDALLERLDRQTATSVLDYLDDTRASRSLGFAIVAGLSAAAGIAVDRLVGHLMASKT
ncbi:MAG TPA: hypothetical protein VFV87_15835 [Pirellulaceae bacterium]|nr:hypothetical protein [Pirellulaceae bacterium]